MLLLFLFLLRRGLLDFFHFRVLGNFAFLLLLLLLRLDRFLKLWLGGGWWSVKSLGFVGGMGCESGNVSLELQDDIDVLLRLSYDAQRQGLLELCPQFKLIQYSLEKLLFTEEDQFLRKLFCFKEGFNPFIDSGFDQYAQNSINPITYGYNKYHINTFSQSAGLTFGKNHLSLGFSLGIM